MGNNEFTGRVIKLMPYGIFVKLDEGKVGFIHVSQLEELAETVLKESIKQGDKVLVKVSGKGKDGKLNLSFLRKVEDNGEENKENYPAKEIKDSFEQKLKKFLRESQESQSLYNKRIKRHRGMAA